MTDTDIEARLRKCFAAVFRDLSDEAIPSATMEAAEGWDSAATVMLVTVIEEEFGIQMELGALEHLVSFRLTLDYLTEVLPTNDRSDVTDARMLTPNR